MKSSIQLIKLLKDVKDALIFLNLYNLYIILFLTSAIHVQINVITKMYDVDNKTSSSFYLTMQ